MLALWFKSLSLFLVALDIQTLLGPISALRQVIQKPVLEKPLEKAGILDTLSNYFPPQGKS